MNRVVAALAFGLLGPLASVAQEKLPPIASPTDEDLAVGRRLFDSQCARCHGREGSGGEGPTLQRPRLRRGPDDVALLAVIRDGVSGTSMQGAWQLSEREITRVGAYVRSLGRIPPQPLPGDAARGRALFEGKGGCTTCHVVAGKGGPLGPELTEVGSQRGPEQLRRSHVPLMVRWPGQIEPGTVRDDLVAFVDFGPTMLAMAGASVPSRMQGQVFLGDRRAKEREYVYAARDRMDEVPDRIRAVRDKRFEYIRNFHPELPYSQPIAYNEASPTMRAWRRLHEEGRLTGPPEAFFAPTKPREELYDTETDRDEVHNLAVDPTYQPVLVQMRSALDVWIRETKDLGEVPEEELVRRGIVRDVLK